MIPGNTVDTAQETLFTVGMTFPTTHFSITCPCGCGTAVQASDAGFSATTVEVAPCDTYAAIGVRSSTVRKSWAYANAVTERPVQHRDGLVVFA